MKVTYSNVRPALEAVKQGLRIFAVSVIPLLINQLNQPEINWRAILVTIAIAILMSIDKFMHLEGKLEDNPQLTKGLTRF